MTPERAQQVTLVVDASLGLQAAPDLLVLTRERRRRGWNELVLGEVLNELETVAVAVVLAADPTSDPGAAPLADAARAAGAELVLLPEEPGSRAFLVAVGRRWSGDAASSVAVRLQTLSSALANGSNPDPVRALGAAAIARWALREGVECGWCRGGRRVRGGACSRCGAVSS